MKFENFYTDKVKIFEKPWTHGLPSTPISVCSEITLRLLTVLGRIFLYILPYSYLFMMQFHISSKSFACLSIHALFLHFNSIFWAVFHAFNTYNVIIEKDLLLVGVGKMMLVWSRYACLVSFLYSQSIEMTVQNLIIFQDRVKI